MADKASIVFLVDIGIGIGIDMTDGYRLALCEGRARSDMVSAGDWLSLGSRLRALVKRLNEGRPLVARVFGFNIFVSTIF